MRRAQRAAPKIDAVDPSLAPLAHRVSILIRDFSHAYKRMAADLKEKFATDHLAQSRVSKSVVCIHAMICSLSRLDRDIRNGISGEDLDRDRLVVEHLFDLFEREIEQHRRELKSNADASMRPAAESVLKWSDTLPNGNYAIPESTPVSEARGKGKTADQEMIQQFGAGTVFSGKDC